MQTDTPEALLEAVGVNPDTRGDIFDYVTKCDGCGDYTGAYPDGYKCSRCNGTHHFVENRYTGPALGTPELDALLLVAGQKWLRDCYLLGSYDHSDRVQSRWNAIAFDAFPGHALARAIKEIAT